MPWKRPTRKEASTPGRGPPGSRTAHQKVERQTKNIQSNAHKEGHTDQLSYFEVESEARGGQHFIVVFCRREKDIWEGICTTPQPKMGKSEDEGV